MSGNLFDIRSTVVYDTPMRPQPKIVPDRDEDYLQFIRSEPCVRCNHPSPSDPHHHPLAGHSGKGTKTSDYRTLPLCRSRACHPDMHQYGKTTFWGDLDAVEAFIVRLNIRYFFALKV
jgi:hypothetical protein